MINHIFFILNDFDPAKIGYGNHPDFVQKLKLLCSMAQKEMRVAVRPAETVIFGKSAREVNHRYKFLNPNTPSCEYMTLKLNQ